MKPNNKHNRTRKIALILFVLGIASAIVLSYGKPDAFYPWNISNMLDIFYIGYAQDISAICFDSFFSIICMVVGINPIQMLELPILILPLFTLSWIILYNISKNQILSVLLTITLYCSFTSSTIYTVWIHSVGTLNLLLIIYLLYLWIKEPKRSNKISLLLCVILSLISLNYGSYNNMGLSAIILGMVFVIVIFVSVYDVEKRKISFRQLLKPSYIGLMVIFLFVAFLIFGANSFYLTFFSFVENMLTSGVSGVDKLISAILNVFGYTAPLNTPLAQYYYAQPIYLINTIAIISRYTIYLMTVLIYGYWLVKSSIINKMKIEAVDQLITAIFIGSAIFALIRTFLAGQVGTGWMYLPFVIIMARLWALAPIISLRNISLERGITVLFVIINIVLLMGSIGPAINSQNDLESIPEISVLSNWSNTYSTNIVSSDVFTFGTLGMVTIINNNENGISSLSHHYQCFRDGTQILSFLNQSVIDTDKDNIVINWWLAHPSASISDWVTLKSWKTNEQQITDNPNYNSICTEGYLDYLLSTNKTKINILMNSTVI